MHGADQRFRDGFGPGEHVPDASPKRGHAGDVRDQARREDSKRVVRRSWSGRSDYRRRDGNWPQAAGRSVRYRVRAFGRGYGHDPSGRPVFRHAAAAGELHAALQRLFRTGSLPRPVVGRQARAVRSVARCRGCRPGHERRAGHAAPHLIGSHGISDRRSEAGIRSAGPHARWHVSHGDRNWRDSGPGDRPGQAAQGHLCRCLPSPTRPGCAGQDHNVGHIPDRQPEARPLSRGVLRLHSQDQLARAVLPGRQFLWLAPPADGRAGQGRKDHARHQCEAGARRRDRRDRAEQGRRPAREDVRRGHRARWPEIRVRIHGHRHRWPLRLARPRPSHISGAVPALRQPRKLRPDLVAAFCDQGACHQDRHQERHDRAAH